MGANPTTATAAAARPAVAPATDPLVVALVLNWNNLPDTLECVRSVRTSDYPNLALWVVDNDSIEDPTPVLQKECPEIRVLRNSRNLGYGGGNNSGLRMAMAQDATYVLLLNNDVVVAPGMVRRLVMAAESDARIAMATPVVFYYDRPTDVYWDGGFVNWATGDTPHDSRPLAVDGGLVKSEWLDGCVLLARVAAIQEIGLLDERYFLYFEDTEWSVRALRRGWKNVVVTDAQAWHKVSRSTGGNANPAVQFYFLRNRYLFMRAHHPHARSVRWRIRYLRRVWRDYLWARHEGAAREAIIAASFSLVRESWGPYEISPRRRWLVVGLDTVLAPVRVCTDVVKLGVSWFRRLKGMLRERANS